MKMLLTLDLMITVRPNKSVKWDALPVGGFEGLVFYQGLAASFGFRRRSTPYRNVNTLA